jgi:hypothetical protein
VQELIDHLESLGRSAAAAPEQTTVDADLRRGRGALKRRRRHQGTAGIAAAAVLAVAGVAVWAGTGNREETRHASDRTTNSTARTSPPAQTHNTISTRPAHPGAHRPRVRLVAYTGAQPAGFTVTEIPAGYVLQGAQPTTLDIARPSNHASIDSFVDKVVVSLQSTDGTTPSTGTKVTVNGQPGVINVQDGVHTLSYRDGSHEVQVQAWSNIHLTDDQLVTFADGVTVTSAVQSPKG